MLGTYSTFDCPVNAEGHFDREILNKAFLWLKKRFVKIGGNVRLYLNPHDFGQYYSFEIDYPAIIDQIELIDGDFDEDDDEQEQKRKIKEDLEIKEDWETKADEIESDYSRLFF